MEQEETQKRSTLVVGKKPRGKSEMNDANPAQKLATHPGPNWLPALFLLVSWLWLSTPALAQFTYATNNGTLTITGYTGSGGSLIIPSSTNGLQITDLGDYAFAFTAVTSVNIPGSVTNIGNFTFAYCLNLTNVTIPSSVHNLGIAAFNDCTSLTGVAVPNGVTSIGKTAFYDCISLTSLSLGDTVTNIDLFAFYDCTSLTSVTIPSSLTNIGDYIFEGCSALTNVTISSGVNSIGDAVFSGCSSLTDISIPNSVMYIGNSTFSGCGSLTHFIIPDTIVSLGDTAFSDCTNLTSITIGAGVTNIGVVEFADCDDLTNIMVSALNSSYSSSRGILFDKNQDTLIEYPDGLAGSYTIPNSVTSVADNAFAGCVSLSGVVIPNNVTSLGDSAFFNCIGLAGITIGDGVSTIGTDTFYGCSNLANVLIGNGVTSIGDGAFTSCIRLTSMIIPDNVVNLGNAVFDGCSRLTNVLIGSGVSSFGGNEFAFCNELTAITVSASNPFYSSVGGVLFNDDLTSLIEYPAGLTNAYVIPDGVTSIGVSAFEDCFGLTRITVPASVTDIGDEAFLGCSSLSGLYFQGNAPNLDGVNVFYDVDSQAVVYYVSGTANWSATYGGLPTVMLNPPSPISNILVQNDQFGFTFTGTNGQAIIFENCTNLANPNWQPLQTNVLNGTMFVFTDSHWRNYPRRFYRVISSP